MTTEKETQSAYRTTPDYNTAWKAKSEKFKTSTNPFALMVKVPLRSMEVKNGEVDQRFHFKQGRTREFYKHGYDKKNRRPDRRVGCETSLKRDRVDTKDPSSE